MKLSMHIPNTFPGFENEPVLLVVSGNQETVMYRAFKRTIERIDAFKIPERRYSDNENSVLHKETKHVMERDFLHELKNRIKKIPPQFTHVYIFSPGSIKNKIISAFENIWKNKIVAYIEGTYYKYDPLHLLQKIKEHMHTPVTPMSMDAKKVLTIPKMKKKIAS